ncbi:MAG TPA: helix-turn-helix domain-containing protein, partial [Thermoanaerobaculia bacterium]
LQQYDWPGNVRELENAIERAMVVARGHELVEEDFSLALARTGLPTTSGRSLEDIEKAHILSVLEECNFNQTRAADVLHIDRVTLHNKLKRYGWTRHGVEAS